VALKPETLQILSQLAIFIGIIATALGGFGSYYFGKKIEKITHSAARVKEEKLQGKIGELLEGNRSLQLQLEPFEDLAKRLHPSLDTQEALKELRQNLEDVERRADIPEKEMVPRTLAPQQRTAMVAMLRQIGSRKVTVTAVKGDQNALRFATELKAVIEEGGWDVKGVNQTVRSGPTRGLSIDVASDPAPQVAHDLFRALRSADLEVGGNLNKQLSGDDIQLVVDGKQ